MPQYTIEYYAGTYKGTMTVRADDEQDAKDIARARVQKQMTLPMYSDGYKVIDVKEDDN